ncbi:hypothetical protein GCM10027422_35170 [Hymenobacter arcticus]
MCFSRPILLALALSVQAVAAHAQDAPAPACHYPRTSLGLTLGWGAPYGWGLDVSHLLTHRLDLNAGVGASITGIKIGVGATYYLAPEHRVSPFFGANLVHSGGRQDVHVTEAHRVFDHTYTSSEEAHINFLSTNLLHLRSGLRWQPTPRFAVLGTLGYGFVLGDDPIEYLAESSRQSLRDAVHFLSPGGVEVSLGVAFALSHRE